MSFFDDEDRVTTTHPPRPAAAGGDRETARARPGGRADGRTGGRGRGRVYHPPAGGGDHHAIMVRRRIVAGVAVAVVVVLVLLIDGCLKSGTEEALRTYNHEAGQLAQESDSLVSAPLFKTLAGASATSTQSVEEQIDQLRAQAQSQAARARALSVPGQMDAAQRNLTLVLDLREEALTKIAGLVRTALGGQSQGQQASASIAGTMEEALASDVVYSQRVAPLIQQALTADGIHGVSTAGTQFLPNLGWLDPSTVAQRLTGKSSGSTPSSQIAPGTHGSALTGVTVGSTTLAPESTGTVNHLATGSNPTFAVAVEDSGSNSETDVQVAVTVTAGGHEYKRTNTIPRTEPGVTSKANVTVEGVPLETAARVAVYVLPVPGETNSENNKGSYLAVFGQ